MTRRAAALGECMVEVAVGADGATAHLGFGGDTLNTAVYLARESAGQALSVHYVTALGEDRLSERMVAAWADEGIETGLVFRLSDRLPGLYLINTDETGERSFLYWRESAAARELLTAGRSRALGEALAGFDLLYLSGITAAILNPAARRRLLELLEGLRGRGTRIAFDPNYRPRLWKDAATAREVITAIGGLAHVVLPSAADERDLFGDADAMAVVERWRGLGAEEVVVKDAGRACLAVGPEGSRSVPARSVVEPVDTTAAGDSFNGAYLAARLAGAPTHAAAERGHALAARVITHRGALIPPSAG